MANNSSADVPDLRLVDVTARDGDLACGLTAVSRQDLRTLAIPFERKWLEQGGQAKGRWLPPIKDRFHNVRRQEG